MENVEKKILKIKENISENTVKRKIFDKIITEDFKEEVLQNSHDISTKEIKYITDCLSKLNRQERKLISKIFEIIDKVLTPDLAENLKMKIKEEFE